ncbi:hypothetical protein WMF18_06690 [Sorangium sp. So ce315]|uniref:hypothetical protein n=1 Tax=Sorangium sp. So ce315 TaxID=3133299 RepID=UPI003F5F47B6
MRALLLLIAACALCACTDDTRSPGIGAGDSGTSGTGGPPDAIGPLDAGIGPDAAAPPSPLDRPGELPRPPGSRLPDDLKPPVR